MLMESDENSWLFLELLADQHFGKVLSVCLVQLRGVDFGHP